MTIREQACDVQARCLLGCSVGRGESYSALLGINDRPEIC